MKILIVSQAKTGNTWTKNLLSAVYRLPIVDFPTSIYDESVHGLGSNWISQAHLIPKIDLIEWAQSNSVTLVTCIRHPADVLVSLKYYVNNYRNSPDMPKELIEVFCTERQDETESISRYLKEAYFLDVQMNVLWLLSGKSIIVRYEDLWRDPFEALKKLTDEISIVSQGDIDRAIEKCDINLLRKYPGNDSKFFRKGRVGDWRKELPAEHIDIFKSYPPYPAQLRCLGYTMEKDDPLTTLPAKERKFRNPFLGMSTFSNGLPIPVVVVAFYIDLSESQKRQWPDPLDAEEKQSFLHYVNALMDETGTSYSERPGISRLAKYIYDQRRDVQSAFPDLHGKDRISFIEWFIHQAKKEYDLGEFFTETMRESFVHWATMPAETDMVMPGVPLFQKLANRKKKITWFREDGNVDGQGQGAVASKPLIAQTSNPVVNNYMMNIYRNRTDLQKAYPDPLGENRYEFVLWFIYIGAQEVNCMKEIIIDVVNRWIPSGQVAI